MAVSKPFEILDLPNGGELVTRVTRIEEGEAEFKPARAPEGIMLHVVRLYVPQEDKATAPPWWDVSATTLQPSLVASLVNLPPTGRWIRILKQGVAPRARFSLELLPLNYPGPAFVGIR